MSRKAYKTNPLSGFNIRKAYLVCVGLALVMLFGQGCATVDLRTEKIVQEGIRPDAERQGRTLLQAAAEAHGLEKWRQRRTTETRIRDDWDSFLASVAGFEPWDEEDEFIMRYHNNTFTAQLEFTAGDRKGETIGIQSWNTYRREPGAELVFEDDSDTEFFLPTFVYFLELPFRVLNAGLVSFAGQDTFNGATYDKVFLTWNKAEPHSENDQYVLWINTSTRLIDLAEYTVRDQFDFARGTIYLDDKRVIDGITTPFLMTVTSDVQSDYLDDYLHQMRVLSLAYDTFDSDILYPKKNLKYIGDAKPDKN